MKKYIAIAALGVASIIITAAALNSAEPQTTGQPTPPTAEQIKYDREFVEAQNAEIAKHLDFTGAQPVKRPDVLMRTQLIDGKEVTTIITKGENETHSRVSVPFSGRPEEYQPGMAKLVTPVDDDYKALYVYVMTSTDLTNWYPVSYGEKYSETKKPRYFRMWVEPDLYSFLNEQKKMMQESILKRQQRQEQQRQRQGK